MSVSKLESLPNEILIDIFEKYINGVDILIAFANSQNERFNALILQCQRFYFNFLNCRKDHFGVCISSLLSASYIEKIEVLVLSEQNTPGQIHAFLSVFPLFISFRRLRKLYLHLNDKSIDWPATQRAILSLSNITIHPVIIKVMDTAKQSPLNYVINDIISLKTTKRLLLTNHVQHTHWSILTDGFSKVEYLEYLTNFDISYKFQHLEHIFRRGSHLKYLNVQLTTESFYSYHHSINPANNNIISMPNLHTLILSFERDDPTTFDMLAQYLKVLPVLRRLEIKAHRALLDASAWEAFLQTSLPLLTHFTLKTTTSRINKGDIENTLASFETPFWIEMKNFYMIITEHKHLDSNRFYLHKMQVNDQDEFNQPVIQWWIVPIRARIDDIPTSDIMSFGISGVAHSLSYYYYFKNVRHLVIYNLDNDLLEWLLTFVNYSQIEYLDLSFLNNQPNTIISLLSHVKNITSLRIQYSRLLVYQHIYRGKDNCLKYLDISVDKHSFGERDINTISALFPNIEHIAINTTDLSNIPLLQTYLPHLCSLTFKDMDNQFSSYTNHKKNEWHDQLRQEVQFSFQRTQEWITVWIDRAALEEPYWQKFNLNSSIINTT